MRKSTPETLKISKNLKQLRIARGLSQKDVAEAINKTYQQVQKYEAGVDRVSMEVLYKLKSLYLVPYSRFFMGLDSDVKSDEGPETDAVLLALDDRISSLSPKAARQNLQAIAKILLHSQ